MRPFVIERVLGYGFWGFLADVVLPSVVYLFGYLACCLLTKVRIRGFWICVLLGPILSIGAWVIALSVNCAAQGGCFGDIPSRQVEPDASGFSITHWSLSLIGIALAHGAYIWFVVQRERAKQSRVAE
jgi:hypothetical protein